MKLTQVKVGSLLSLPLLSDLVSVLNTFVLTQVTIWPTQVFEFTPSDNLVWVLPDGFVVDDSTSQICSFLGDALAVNRDAVIVTRYDVVFSLAPKS